MGGVVKHVSFLDVHQRNAVGRLAARRGLVVEVGRDATLVLVQQVQDLESRHGKRARVNRARLRVQRGVLRLQLVVERRVPAAVERHLVADGLERRRDWHGGCLLVNDHVQLLLFGAELSGQIAQHAIRARHRVGSAQMRKDSANKQQRQDDHLLIYFGVCLSRSSSCQRLKINCFDFNCYREFSLEQQFQTLTR